MLKMNSVYKWLPHLVFLADKKHDTCRFFVFYAKPKFNLTNHSLLFEKV